MAYQSILEKNQSPDMSCTESKEGEKAELQPGFLRENDTGRQAEQYIYKTGGSRRGVLENGAC
ncbi:hypothetical protein E2C01_008470 [Portunus trituberculatus]|uniref:Uncharacterized protein n=1 Tax=Portunus trituberculatus TaxID=210409 RepID=A0A5B7D384_PORTR|nr:hypothetical protein [Portunus trituberculatus]